MTTKTHTARQAGPITFDARLTAGNIRVTVGDRTHADAGNIRVTVGDRTHAEVTVSTADSTGPSADAVNKAEVTDQGGKVTVKVRDIGGGGGVVVQGGGVQTNVFHSGGGVFVQGSNFGGVIVTGRDVIVNGVRVSGGSGAIVVGGSPILIEARLPLGSSVAADTTSADIDVTGTVVRAQVRTVSGDINLDGVADLDVGTTSGDITVEAFAGNGQAQTVSGDIRVHAVRESSLRARAVSGDVRVSGARVALDASTVSGRVSQR